MRQTKLTEWVLCKYILNTSKAKKKGLAEKQIKKRLEKYRWELWRGSLLNINRRQKVYPNVKKKYAKLCYILKPEQLELLQYLCTQTGMPDYLCHRKEIVKFVECKLEYETLSKRQRRCIERLQSNGFKVEIHVLVEKTKIRKAHSNVFMKKKTILDKQNRLKRHYSTITVPVSEGLR